MISSSLALSEVCKRPRSSLTSTIDAVSGSGVATLFAVPESLMTGAHIAMIGIATAGELSARTAGAGVVQMGE